MSFHSNPCEIIPACIAPVNGRISLVGAGPGAADLLTLRAVRCLGQADVVFYDRLVDPEALDFVHPGALRVFVGKEVGANSWPQDRIDTAIVLAALQGLRVVRRKSGDPSIFGRAAEEIAAARAHGIAVEIIPGITAASAAAASMCRPLTERGITDRVVLATATSLTGNIPSDIAEIARPGTSLIFYMAMQQLQSLSDQLIAAGVAPDQPVTVASNIAKSGERSLETTLTRLWLDCQHAKVRNPAVILIRLAKAASLPDIATRKEPIAAEQI